MTNTSNTPLKSYVAKTAYGQNITSVLAANEEDARRIIRDELAKNPSRFAYLRKWQMDGEIVEVKA